MTDKEFAEAISEIYRTLLAKQERLPADMERVLYEEQWYIESEE